MIRFVLFDQGIETLAYFSKKIAEVLLELGYEVLVYELDAVNKKERIEALYEFCKKQGTWVITFNFNGLRGEEEFYQEKELIWRRYGNGVINIMVDHPFYYPALIENVVKELGVENYYQVAIDRDHEKFMKRFYPQWKEHVYFFPLAGSMAEKSLQPKVYDVAFVGNYTPPERFRSYIERIDEEYTAFYEGIIEDLIDHPGMTMEAAFEKHLKREMGEMSDEDLRTCMGNMIFIDLYVRYYFRGEIVKLLAESGIPVHIWGSGFDLMECACPENIIMEGATDTEGCLDALAKSKVALNVMPWFKNGAHDRIYSAMLNGAVCVSDSSIYLDQELENGEQIIFYQLEAIAELPRLIRQILNNEERRKQIAASAYDYVKERHTWRQRTEELLRFLNDDAHAFGRRFTNLAAGGQGST